MHFSFTQKIMFKHCDPAGIAFYPKYFEIINDTVETFFAEALGWSFERLHETNAVPTAAINVQFQSPSRLGDFLRLDVTVERLGTSSLQLSMRAMVQEVVRFDVNQTLVCIGHDGKSKPWPAHVRLAIGNLGGEQTGLKI